ncbi:MAG: SdpI family protein [Armatimonadota bacterium]
MTTRHMIFWSMPLIICLLAYSLWLYPGLPDKVPTHWSWKGEADGWSSKPIGAFLLPGLTAALWLVFLALPWLSPRGFKVEPFRATYNLIVLLVLALMAYIHVVALQAALHPRLDVSRALIGGIFLLFGGIGLLLDRVKRNFWVGIRTPWTLASDEVWERTHRMSAKLYALVGFLGALAIWLGTSPVLCLGCLLIAALVPVVYSLVLYKQMERRGLV